jgi:hypothetical protein
VTTYPHLASRLNKECSLTLLPFWSFMACSRKQPYLLLFQHHIMLLSVANLKQVKIVFIHYTRQLHGVCPCVSIVSCHSHNLYLQSITTGTLSLQPNTDLLTFSPAHKLLSQVHGSSAGRIYPDHRCEHLALLAPKS